ncbi:MAG: lipoyl synthase [Candidatus Omnitrophota bacterium]|nr:lipoyl synthase [Candidatus Omnitrophota bacterium]
MKDTPHWLKKPVNNNRRICDMKSLFSRYKVNTVCEGALCPNLNECFSKGFATFLILGDACTRSCGFCSVKKADPVSVDPAETERIAEVVRRLGLRHVVITSVTRDDLADGGAGQFVRVISVLKASSRKPAVEALVPDFNGEHACVKKIVGAGPDIFGHNIETVPRLYPIARSGSIYERSLDVLGLARRVSSRMVTKSGIMVGLGETEEELVLTMKDLRQAGCDVLTIGQYLRPGPENLPVERFVRPEEFEKYKSIGIELGFKYVSSGPFVRSSYLAEEAYQKMREAENDRCYITAIGRGY